MSKRGSLYIYHISIFLIYLVITPVIHAAGVMADFSAGLSGYDNVPNIRRATGDVTIINVSASIAGEKVTSPQIKLLSEPTKQFDCTKGNTSEAVNCSMTIAGDLQSGANIFDVQLFRPDGSEAEPKQTLTIYADGLPPAIHSFSLERNGSDVYAKYRVSDSACASCDASICAGVSKIEFLLDNSNVGSVDFTNYSCVPPEGSAKLSIPPKNGSTTNNTICIDVYDRLNQRSSKCNNVVMDFSPPKLINASLWYGNNMIKYTKGEPISGATLKAYISEDTALNISTLIANISALNYRQEFSSTYGNIDMSANNKLLFDISCSNVSTGIYLCTWSNLLLIIPASASPDIKISVSDTVGNKLAESYTLPVIFDNIRPKITAIRSGIADDHSRYWVGAGNNTLYVDISESGSGFNDRKLFLDLSSFGPQKFAGKSTTVYPANCTSGWTCTFEYANVDSGTKSGEILSVSIVGQSSDDAGNLVEGTTNAGFYYDDEPPQIINIINSSVCPTAPDSIDLTINVSEEYSGGVTAHVSAPELSTTAFPQEIDCEETEDDGIWTCDISIENLVTVYTKDRINITLTDRAGNSNTTTIMQEVCEAAPGTPPNVVKSTAKAIPSSLDKIMAGYIAYPAFAEVSLKYTNPPNSVQAIRISSCSASSATISDAKVVTALEFKNPVIGFKVSLDPKASENATKLSVNCTLDLIIRSGNKVYSQPEKEMVNIDFDLHGTIFGSLNKSMESKVTKLEKDIEAKQSEIDGYDTAIKVLGTICTIAEILAMLVAFLQVIKIVMYAVGWVVWGVVYAACCVVTLGGGCGYGNACWIKANAAGALIYYNSCWPIDYATTTITTFVWQIDSLPSTAFLSPGFYLKLLCAWFTCRFSESNNFIEMFGKSGSANGGAYTFSRNGRTDNGQPNSLESGVLSPLLLDIGLFSSYDWSPYQSIHIARQMGCLPGIKYNLMKEKQVLCMKKNCYKQFVSSGFSPELCENLYKTETCLYVDSAAWWALGEPGVGSFFQGIIEYLLTQLQGALLSTSLRALGCGYPYSAPLVGYGYQLDNGFCGGPAMYAMPATVATSVGVRKGLAIAGCILNPLTCPVELIRIAAETGDTLGAITALQSSTKWACIGNPMPTCALYEGVLSLGCGLTVSMAIWLDVGDFIDWEDISWNDYEAKLTGDNYCG
jgi:hypothetical protein